MTTLGEMRGNAMQPFMEPDLTARLILPCRRAGIGDGGIGRIVGPLACAHRQAPGVTWNCRAVLQIALRPEHENRVAFSRWRELIQIRSNVSGRRPEAGWRFSRQRSKRMTRSHDFVLDSNPAIGWFRNELGKSGERIQRIRYFTPTGYMMKCSAFFLGPYRQRDVQLAINKQERLPDLHQLMAKLACNR